MSGKGASKTDACGFPPELQTLTSLSPKCKHKTKSLVQNKQAACALGVFSNDGFRWMKPHYTHTQHVNYKTIRWFRNAFWEDRPIATLIQARRAKCSSQKGLKVVLWCEFNGSIFKALDWLSAGTPHTHPANHRTQSGCDSSKFSGLRTRTTSC